MSGLIEIGDRNSINSDENSSNSSQYKTECEVDEASEGLQETRSLLRQNSIVRLFQSVRNRRLKTNSSNVSITTINSTRSRPNKSIRGCSTIVIVVLVEAKGLPDPPNDGQSHSVYCKFNLGSESYRSKSINSSRQPIWGERFKLHIYRNHVMKISVWDKGKQKNFMGSCVLDLSSLQRERSNEVWQKLDDGFGAVHLSITLCTTAPPILHNTNLDLARNEHVWHNLKSDWKRVGQLHVKVMAAKGLSGRVNAYSVVELDNERVQTHSTGATTEPIWNKGYLFNIYDITSTLDVIIYDDLRVALFQDGFLGRVSIPLLNIQNGVPCWYALKDKSRRNLAKGNCPRVLLDVTIYWNPVKSALRIFRPKEIKYVKKPTKFDVVLVYNNVRFIRDTFDLLVDINERYKRAFEWQNRELSLIVLLAWLLFWYNFELWMAPLFLVLPFLFFMVKNGNDDISMDVISEPEANEKSQLNEKGDETSLTSKIHGMPEMTLVITNGIEYIASMAERLFNLVSFKMPFLSYVALGMLVGSAVILYIVPFKYLLMALGIYKFLRKFLNPGRTPNNDFLDFLSRVPDNTMLREWKELSVPEPNVKVMKAPQSLSRSFSA